MIRAPTGSHKTCKGWVQEAAMRMLMNNLDPAVAEKPDELIVYGGRGKAARNWDAYHLIIKSLQNLENDESLLIQSGKPVGVVKTHSDAPRVIIANSNLVGKWANWETFDALEKQGLMMYGQMTAGSWIYIGTQGILQGTYETFAQLARQHYGTDGDLTGKVVLTAGLGGMGGAQPLAVTFCGGICLAVDVDAARIERRVNDRYLDRMTDSITQAGIWINEAKKNRIPLSVGLVGNAAKVFPELHRRGLKPDIITDQTAAHDPKFGYIPVGFPDEQIDLIRDAEPERYLRAVHESIAAHVNTMLKWLDEGAVVFDYGNNLRSVARDAGVARAFDYPGFVPAYIRPLFCEGKGPFRWVALSGDPEDIRATDDAILKLFPNNNSLHRWIGMARERVAFQGLPARICWLGYGERHLAGLLFNEMVRDGRVKAPIVIGRDHLDCGSVASPMRETEAMKDGSDAVADWPILNALVNAVNGASWVSFHHGGGVGMGYSLHAGQVLVADGTPEAAKRIERVLTGDPALGVMRHADAGYSEAIECAKSRDVKIPGLTWEYQTLIC